MKKALGAFALCGFLLATTSTAFAQPYGAGQRAPDQQAPDQHRDNGPGHKSSKHQKGGQDHKGGKHAPSRYQGMHDQGRHEGWYKKGGHLPQSYRGDRYVVSDWHRAKLRQPPHGYHWVRSDNGDYLLVAITTGLIASIIAATR